MSEAIHCCDSAVAQWYRATSCLFLVLVALWCGDRDFIVSLVSWLRLLEGLVPSSTYRIADAAQRNLRRNHAMVRCTCPGSEALTILEQISPLSSQIATSFPPRQGLESETRMWLRKFGKRLRRTMLHHIFLPLIFPRPCSLVRRIDLDS